MSENGNKSQRKCAECLIPCICLSSSRVKADNKDKWEARTNLTSLQFDVFSNSFQVQSAWDGSFWTHREGKGFSSTSRASFLHHDHQPSWSFSTTACIRTRHPCRHILAPITQKAPQGGWASAVLSPPLLIVVGKCSQKAHLDSNVPTFARPWLRALSLFAGCET